MRAASSRCILDVQKARRKGEGPIKNLYLLSDALSLIEDHLEQPLPRETLAAACHVSLSSLEKLFRYALHVGIKEYVQKRRLTLAARLLLSGASVTQTAMHLCYGSTETFCRAFKRVWGCPPSRFQQSWRFSELYPRNITNFKEENAMQSAAFRNLDCSNAYDFLRDHPGAYVLFFDAAHLSEINAVSRLAGDQAIVEMARRISSMAPENTLTLRTGGDEFALLTTFTDADEALAVADRIAALNGGEVVWEGGAFPFSMHVGLTTIPLTQSPDFLSRLEQQVEWKLGREEKSRC